MSLNALNVDLEIYGKEIHGKIKKKVISSCTFSYYYKNMKKMLFCIIQTISLIISGLFPTS